MSNLKLLANVILLLSISLFLATCKCHSSLENARASALCKRYDSSLVDYGTKSIYSESYYVSCSNGMVRSFKDEKSFIEQIYGSDVEQEYLKIIGK